MRLRSSGGWKSEDMRDSLYMLTCQCVLLFTCAEAPTSLHGNFESRECDNEARVQTFPLFGKSQ